MPIYSIKDLEMLCGIKAHTIRMWEKRYGLLKAKRTKTNIRYYSDDDVRKALNLCILYRDGLKISKLACLSEDEINRLVSERTEVDIPNEKSLDALSIYTLELNEYKFLKILEKYIDDRGFYETMIDIIYPFLDKISMMWIAGTIDQVHETFVTSIIKRKLIVEIDRQSANICSKADKFILYLPTEGSQELSMLYVEYLLKRDGFPVINMGKNVQIDNLKVSCEQFKASYVFTIVNELPIDESAMDYLKRVTEKLPVPLLVTGQEIPALGCPSERFIVIKNLKQLRTFTNNLITSK